MKNRIWILVVFAFLFCCTVRAEEKPVTSAKNEEDLSSCYKSVKKPGVKSLKTAECQKVAEFFSAAIDAKPDDPDNYLVLGRCFGLMGQFDMAVQYVDKAIALNPDDWTAHMDKAMNYVALKSFAEARPEFKKALDLLNAQAGKLDDIKMVEDLMKKYDKE